MNSQPPSLLTRSPLFAVAFFGLFISLIYQMAHLLTPLLTPLIWAVILTLALYPFYEKLIVRLKGKRGLAAWGVLFITLTDNFLKPIIIGRKVKNRPLYSS